MTAATAPRRIVCLGNRLVPHDDAGPRVYDALVRRRLPPQVAVVDGALAGLDLLPLLERRLSAQVLFVDAAHGLPSGETAAFLCPQALADRAAAGFDHAAGLPWLLRVAPLAADGPLAPVQVLGVAPEADAAAIERAADVALTALAVPAARRGRDGA